MLNAKNIITTPYYLKQVTRFAKSVGLSVNNLQQYEIAVEAYIIHLEINN